MNVCRTCREPIRWVIMESGRSTPLDDAPVENGNVALEANGKRGIVLAGDELARARAHGEPLYLSHFATCPFADQHRRRKDAAA